MKQLEHVLEVAVLLAIFCILYCKREKFSTDPYGTGLRYYTFNDSTAVGPGSNIDLASRYETSTLLQNQ